jgi:hypothetical protein
MKFNDCQFIHSKGESKLPDKNFFQFSKFIHQSKKPDNILRNIQAKRYFIQLKTNILILLMLVFF